MMRRESLMDSNWGAVLVVVVGSVFGTVVDEVGGDGIGALGEKVGCEAGPVGTPGPDGDATGTSRWTMIEH